VELVVPQSGEPGKLLCQAEVVVGEKVRVVVGDDHPMFREGVVRALVSSGEIDVVAEAEDGLQALDLIRTHQPQVALLDYRMPGMDGAEGFLPKESTRSELVAAVLRCAKGKDVLAPELAAGLASEIRRRNEPDVPALSPREREVLKLIAGGSSIPAMAKELFLAPSTVKTHVQRLYEKLGVNDRGAAVAEAMRRKLLD
jgi:two-component system nitrate/nitrite response regulator NarL